MILTTEIILTLQQLKKVIKKDIGTKIILEIAKNDSDINKLEDLAIILNTFKQNPCIEVKSSDLIRANELARRIINLCNKDGITIISYFDDSFPEMLRHCINEYGEEDPPILLYCRGNLNILNKVGIAIIGTRRPTENGIKAGKYFSSKFSQEGFNIISGLAEGCDTSAHIGTLSTNNGATTAILANGLDWESIYPQSNLQLAKNIVLNGGLLLSEYEIFQKCNKYSLIARDRLQAGLAHATVVVQSNVKGGTMHAVHATIKAKKPLFAVKYKNPKDYDNEVCLGNTQLINTGQAIALSSNTYVETFQKIKEYFTKEKTGTDNVNKI